MATTELERLRAENQKWRTDAMKREVREAQQEILIREARTKAEAKRAADERAKQQAAEVEECRRGSWVNHLLAEAVARGDVESLATATDIMAAIPTDGSSWPPGRSASDLFPRISAAPVQPADDDENVPSLVLAARKAGARI